MFQSIGRGFVGVIRFIPVFISCFWGCPGAVAQETGFPIIRNYPPKEYGDAPQVFSVLQDKNSGIMYFGMPEVGLTSYDGVRWTGVPSLNNTIARSLCQTEDGRIYVGATDHFGYLETDAEGKPVYRNIVSLLPDTTLKLGAVWAVKAAGKAVYFQTLNYIFEYLPSEKKIQVYGADPNGDFRGSFVDDQVYYTRLSKKGLMKIENGQMIEAPHSDFFKGKNVFSKGSVPYAGITQLIATRTEGVYLYDAKSNTPPKKLPLQKADFLLDNLIYCAAPLTQNRFALGSLKQGVLLIDPQGKTLQHFHEGKMLQNDGLLDINNDKNGNLWLGLSNGLSKTEHGQDLGYWDKNAGLKGVVLDFIRSQNVLYASTDQKTYYFDADFRPQEVKGLPSGQHWDLAEFTPPANKGETAAGNQTTILLAGTQHGIYQIKDKQASLIYKGDHALMLQQSKHYPNRLYSTDWGKDFISLLYENGAWKPEGKWEGIEYEIRGLVEENDGTIWMATFSNGILKAMLKPEDRSKVASVKHYTEKDGLPSLNNSKPFWYQNKIIFGTVKGLYVHNPKNDRFEPFCGLGKQFCDGRQGVYSFQELSNGNIYLASLSNKKQDPGYFKPDGKGGYDWIYKPFRRLPEIAGIRAMHAEENGLVWILGSEGLFRYDASQDDKDYGLKFDCWVREVLQADSLVFFGGGPINGRPAGFAPQTFGYAQNGLKFRFAAPFFDKEEKTLYSFKLEGFDKNWSEWSRQSEKEYTNLREGRYTFLAKAKNIYDVESTHGSYAFRVLPPWYRTWWAYLLYTVFSATGIYGFVKLNTRRHKKDKVVLEQIVKDRTAEIWRQKQEIQTQAEGLKASNIQLQELQSFKDGLMGMIVHDLKNPLSVIIDRSEGLADRQAAKPIARAAADMLRLCMDILDAQKYETAALVLDARESPLFETAERALEAVADLARQKNILLSHTSDTVYYVRTDPDILERVFVNLLTNAIKFTPSGGEVSITSEVSGDMLRIGVLDNGSGIPDGMHESIFEKFAQAEAKKSGVANSTGLGLSFCKMAVEAHGEGCRIWAESEPGKGSQFYFLLPLTKTEGLAGPPQAFGNLRKELSESEKEEVAAIKAALAGIAVYDATAWRGVLKTAKERLSGGPLEWAEAIEAAYYSYDETTVAKLLRE